MKRCGRTFRAQREKQQFQPQLDNQTTLRTMRRTTTSQGIRQLLSSRPSTLISEKPCISRPSHACLRAFSNTSNTAADNPLSSGSFSQKRDSKSSTDLLDIFEELKAKRKLRPIKPMNTNYLAETNPDGSMPPSLIQGRKEPHHFHIYATKHNTHITVTTPERNPLISVACGNIGFRKSGRKHYDSAFQLAAYVMGQMQDRGINAQITNGLEVVLRGFGAGREAVTKALLGAEGRYLKDKIRKVSDSTRLKFGGTRGKKPRRLG